MYPSTENCCEDSEFQDNFDCLDCDLICETCNISATNCLSCPDDGSDCCPAGRFLSGTDCLPCDSAVQLVKELLRIVLTALTTQTAALQASSWKEPAVLNATRPVQLVKTMLTTACLVVSASSYYQAPVKNAIRYAQL